jgi:hypothetical protein
LKNLLKIEAERDSLSSKEVTRSSIKYIMMREKWNGFRRNEKLKRVA